MEYVIRLADFVRDNLPEVYDEHLFTLESLVRLRMKEKNIELAQLLTKKNSAAQQPLDQQQGQEQHPAAENGAEVRRDSFQYQSRVAPKKLLCLKVWSHPTQPATRFLVFFKCFSSVHCVRRRVDVYNQRGATISPFSPFKRPHQFRQAIITNLILWSNNYSSILDDPVLFLSKLNHINPVEVCCRFQSDLYTKNRRMMN